METNFSTSNKQEFLSRFRNAGFSPETCENYYNVLTQFFAGKLPKYKLEQSIKSLLPPHGIKLHNDIFIETLQKAQQADTTIPSLASHEKDAKYIKRRVVVKRPLKYLTSLNKTTSDVGDTEMEEKETTGKNKKRKRSAPQRKKPEITKDNEKEQTVENLNDTQGAMHRKQDNHRHQYLQHLEHSEHKMNPMPHVHFSSKLCQYLQEYLSLCIGRRMKQMAVACDIYDIDHQAVVTMFYGLELHLIDIIREANEERRYISNKLKTSHQPHSSWKTQHPMSLGMRDIYSVSEKQQNLFGDPYSLDRTSLAFRIF